MLKKVCMRRIPCEHACSGKRYAVKPCIVFEVTRSTQVSILNKSKYLQLLLIEAALHGKVVHHLRKQRLSFAAITHQELFLKIQCAGFKKMKARDTFLLNLCLLIC